MNVRIAALLAVAALFSTAVFAADELPPPVRVVIQVLQLTPDQTTSLVQALVRRDQTVAPLAQQAQKNDEALGKLLASDAPDATAVGSLAIETTKLRQQIAKAAYDARIEFEGTLDPEQIDRLSQLRLSAQLAQIIPAFRAAGLID